MTSRPDLPPLLVPMPRRLELTGGRVNADPGCAAERVDTAADLAFAGPEAYRLRITSAVQAPVLIEARSDAGVRHARATLDQLVRQYAESLPCMEIEDGPALASRGFMLDVSRDRVPTMARLFEIVDLLASLKYNHLQLYTEHTFAYEGHEDVWRDASPITPAEVRELDVYCRQRGIELAANQNCFGHLSTWLRLPRYAHLAETHGEWYFEVPGYSGDSSRIRRTGPFSLCPTDPASLEFIEGLLDQLLPCFSSPLVNIGCDETFDVGFGRSAQAVRERGIGGGGDGRAAVYFDFVRAVAAIARRHGKRPMFWADIALSHPDHISLIPEDMIRLAWGYEGDTTWGEWLKRLHDPAQPDSATWVCPGTSSWRSIIGRTTERRANIAGAVREDVAGRAGGFLLTDWGDTGHRQPWSMSLAALAQGAEAAWGGRDGGDGGETDHRAVSLQVFRDEGLRAAPWVDALGDVDLALRRIAGRREPDEPPRPLRNTSALFADLHMPLHPPADDDAALRFALESTPLAKWQATMAALEDAQATLPDALPAEIERELQHTLRVAILAARRAVLRRQGLSDGDRRRLAADVRSIIDEHRELWMLGSRPGGLSSSCRHYERIAEELEA